MNLALRCGRGHSWAKATPGPSFRQARGQLFRSIKLRDLPVPQGPRRVPQPATPGQ